MLDVFCIVVVVDYLGFLTVLNVIFYFISSLKHVERSQSRQNNNNNNKRKTIPKMVCSRYYGSDVCVCVNGTYFIF